MDKNIVDVENITRPYLETLSFSDLSKIADEYGVEVPENLDRRFLICELMELAEDSKRFADDNMVISGEVESDKNDLPKNYNETQISCVLRNPAWGFVFWNISEADSLKLSSIPDCSLMLRICILSSPDELKPEEAFKINASSDTQEQYVLLPANKKYIRVELVYVSKNTGEVLAFSPVIEIPQAPEYLNELQPGKNDSFSDIENLSGIKKVLMEQYKNHRHSFS